ncbi:hypothetical protein [Hyalangium minutum]|uniref:Outer membrane protein beta-barrel domain-containing protein n=1 Tax=Hyalangium minutum TaxID=394096 RepID=A0A085WB73_9BACT|nr:hypothetical protein [Hyalangium minutum]KFE64936.1 hypothetical protein DB31_1954 [Hyalangium minutum]
MPSARAVLCGVLALGVALTAIPAEARFGKRSSDDSSDDKKVHNATAVGEDDDDDDDDDDDSGSSSSGGSSSYSSSADVGAVIDLFALIFTVGTHRAPLAAEIGPDGTVQEQRHAAPLSLRSGLQGGPMSGGAAVDLFLGLEGHRFGVSGMLTGLELPTDDGTAGTDTITLVMAHLTWSFIAEERIRLRGEAGVSTANAPDISFVGLGLAGSVEACVVGPLDVEARLALTPFPHRVVDASAALALHLGALVIRGGYRGLVLDDAGLVDGIVHRDVLGGPYFGLGLTF